MHPVVWRARPTNSLTCRCANKTATTREQQRANWQTMLTRGVATSFGWWLALTRFPNSASSALPGIVISGVVLLLHIGARETVRDVQPPVCNRMERAIRGRRYDTGWKYNRPRGATNLRTDCGEAGRGALWFHFRNANADCPAPLSRDWSQALWICLAAMACHWKNIASAGEGCGRACAATRVVARLWTAACFVWLTRILSRRDQRCGLQKKFRTAAPSDRIGNAANLPRRIQMELQRQGNCGSKRHIRRGARCIGESRLARRTRGCHMGEKWL